MKRIALAAIAALLVGAPALAQGPPDGPGGFPQGGPPPGGGFPGGPGDRMRPRAVSAATLSLRTLLGALALTDAQAVKIALAKEDALEGQRPGPGRGGGRRGGAPDTQKADAAIKAVLSDGQKARLALLVRAAQGLLQNGIQPDALAKLKLGDDQLSALARGESIDDVLSAAQLQVVQSYLLPADGRPRGPDGPGGFDGPPPPDRDRP